MANEKQKGKEHAREEEKKKKSNLVKLSLIEKKTYSI